jgi:hypothetical protein
VQINAVPAIAPITTPAIPPPDNDGESPEFGAFCVVVGTDEEIDCDATDAGGVADVAGVTDADDVDMDSFTPNLGAMVIGSVSQQEAVFPQHQVVEFAVPSQGVIS